LKNELEAIRVEVKEKVSTGIAGDILDKSVTEHVIEQAPLDRAEITFLEDAIPARTIYLELLAVIWPEDTHSLAQFVQTFPLIDDLLALTITPFFSLLPQLFQMRTGIGSLIVYTLPSGPYSLSLSFDGAQQPAKG
jgi:hypothetical protein